MTPRRLDTLTKTALTVLLGSCLLPAAGLAQNRGPQLLDMNSSQVMLGENETQVRQQLKSTESLYQSPFTPSRLTLRGPGGIYVDFEHGKAIEIDYTSSTAGVSIGGVGVGSSVASAKKILGAVASESANEFFYTTARGELVQFRIRSADESIAVIAIVGDKTHLFTRTRAGKIVLQNQ